MFPCILTFQLDCCGFNGPSDWFNTTFFNESGGSFPESCECEQNDTNENCAPFQGTIDEAQTMQLIWNEVRRWSWWCGPVIHAGEPL